MSRRAVLAALVTQILFACGDDGDDGELAAFPADYAATYEQVRNCRFSLEHGLIRIRVVASPDALAPYNGRAAPFPTGAIVLKEEYAERDRDCAGPIIAFTVMQKLDVGSSPEMLDWTWQEANGDRRLLDADVPRCVQCHTGCGKPPDGFDGTCAVP